MRTVFIIGFLLITGWLYGQKPGSSGINVGVEGGKILLHSPDFGFDDRGLNAMLRLQYETRLDDSTYWASFYGYPRISLELNYTRYSAYEALGNSIGAIAIVKIPLIRIQRFSTEFNIGTGLAFFHRIYDPMKNPGNTAISTSVNNLTHFGMKFIYNVNESQGFELGASFWHSSNGSINKPNRGLNTFHYGIAYRNYFMNSSFIKDKSPRGGREHARLRLEANSLVAYHKKGDPWESKYLLFSHELMLRLRFSRLSYFTTAFMWELNQREVEFLLNVQNEYNRKAARKSAMRLGIAAGAETLFGRVGLGTQIGYYLRSNILTYSIYNKLYVRYYITEQSGWLPGTSIGVVLKSHGLAAEYVGLRLGIIF